MHILALETSTTSAKALLYDTERGVVRVESMAYGAEVSDVVRQDADAVFDQLLQCGKKAAEGASVGAIGLGCIWHSFLPLDGDMRPLGRIRTWADMTPASTVAAWRQNEDFVKTYYQRTGCMVHSIYPSWQYRHVMEHEKELATATRALSSQGEYMFFRLTGTRLLSRAIAGGSGLMNIHTLDWDEDVLRMLGIPAGQLAPLAEPLSHAPLQAAAAAALGVDAGIPVVAGGADGALNQIGSGGMKKGIMTFSVGTSGAIRMACDAPLLPDKPSTWCYYLAEGKRIAGAATSGATNCVDWFVREMALGALGYGKLEAMAEKADHGDAPVFLPFLYGERCPSWQDARRGGFAGITGAHTLGDMYYALLEGILMNLYHCFTMLTKAGGMPAEIRITGGIEKAPFWLQMASDIFQQPMVTAEVTHASTLGAAALASRALTGAPLENFPCPLKDTIWPNEKKAAHYARRFEKYLNAYYREG